MGRKRWKRWSSSSTSDESKHDVEGDDCQNKEMKDAIDCLIKLVTVGLAKERGLTIDAGQLLPGSLVCREDRDRVWLERGKIKQATTYSDAYITEDYARSIQEERKIPQFNCSRTLIVQKTPILYGPRKGASNPCLPHTPPPAEELLSSSTTISLSNFKDLFQIIRANLLYVILKLMRNLSP